MSGSRSSRRTNHTRTGVLTDDVRSQIERMIVAGKIAAGQKLNANAFAKTLGVSRSPVREALRALEQAGLAQSIPNRGVFVRILDLPEALELYDVRIGLARQAGRLLASRATRDQLTELNGLYGEMGRALDRQDADRYHATNLVFHTRLMECTGNRWLFAIDERIKKQLLLFLRKGISGPAQLRMSHADHRAILDAVAVGDAEAAAAAYERHSITGRQRMLDTVGREHDTMAAPSGVRRSRASGRPRGKRLAGRVEA